MPRVEQQVEQQHQEVDAVQELFDQPIERVVADVSSWPLYLRPLSQQGVDRRYLLPWL